VCVCVCGVCGVCICVVCVCGVCIFVVCVCVCVCVIAQHNTNFILYLKLHLCLIRNKRVY